MTDQPMQPRDKIIPWYFVMFFAVIALVNGVMVTLAVSTNSGLITDHPYERGLAYNAVVSAEQRQEALGWKGDITYANGVLHFSIRDKNGQSLMPDHAIARLSRPTQDGLDTEVTLDHGAAPVQFPLPGQWEIRVVATVHGEQFQQAQRLILP